MLKGKLFSFAVIGLLILGIWTASAAPGGVDQQAVLAGTVVAKGLVTQGTQVREGDVLVLVESITGTAPAARATVDGTVTSVMVKPGDRIKTGDVVAKIEAQRK